MKKAKTLTHTEVLEVQSYLDMGEDKNLISKMYGVCLKTIRRIEKGETWTKVTGTEKVSNTLTSTKIVKQFTDPKTLEYFDNIDNIVAVKNHFSLSFSLPILWGQYYGWDGIHYVAGDGYILWESEDLMRFAKTIFELQTPESPFFSQKAKELPTFALERIMCAPIEGYYKVGRSINGVSELLLNRKRVFIREDYLAIAKHHNLDIREAGAEDKFVYFTKTKSKHKDTDAIVIACISTLEVLN